MRLRRSCSHRRCSLRLCTHTPSAAEEARRDALMADPYWYREPIHAYEIEARDVAEHIERRRVEEQEAREREERLARRETARASRGADRSGLSDAQIAAARDADLVDVIGSRVKLRRAGGNWKGSCPFHDERTPSFCVRPDAGWYCYGCAEGGDVIAFIMAFERLDFIEAVRMLADERGVAA